MDQTMIMVDDDLEDDDDLTDDLIFSGEKRPATISRFLPQGHGEGTSGHFHEEVQPTLVLSESDSDDDIVHVSQQTLVVEVSADEDSSEDLLDMATQDYTEVNGRKQQGKPGTSGGVRQKDGKSSHRSSQQRGGTQRSEVTETTDLRGTLSARRKDTTSGPNDSSFAFIPRQVIDEDEDSDDAVELFAVSTLACDFNADVVNVDDDDDDDTDDISDVEVVTDKEEPVRAKTVAVVSDATVAVASDSTLAVASDATLAVASDATVAVASDATLAVVPDVAVASDATVALDATLAVASDATLAVAPDATLAVASDATLAVAPDATLAVASNTTLAVAPESTVALYGRGKRINKKASLYVPASSAKVSSTPPTQSPAETVPVVASLESQRSDSHDASTQIIDATFVLDNEDSQNVSGKIRNTQRGKGKSDNTNDATQVIDNTLPVSRRHPTRSRYKSPLPLGDEKNRHSHEISPLEPTLDLGSLGKSSQSLEKYERTEVRSKLQFKPELSGRRNEPGRKSNMTPLESTQIFCPGDSDSTQPYETDSSQVILDSDSTQPYETDDSLVKPATCVNTQQTRQIAVDAQVVGGRAEVGLSSQGGTAVTLRTRLSDSPHICVNSSDDSDLEECSVLRSRQARQDSRSNQGNRSLQDNRGQPNAVLTTDREPTLAYDLAVDREPTLAYDLAVDREPTLAYDLAVDREPTLAYDLAVDREPTLAYDLAVDREPTLAYDLAVDREPTLAYDLALDREPTLAYDLAVDREPTLAYDLAVDREPTLAYDLAVDREPTLAYDLAAEEKPGKNIRKQMTRRHSRNNAGSENPDPETTVSVNPLPSRSPLKSALVDRRRSPSPARKHVAFAEAMVKEDEDKQAGKGRGSKTPGVLPSQGSDAENDVGSTTRLRQTRNQKRLLKPAPTAHREDDQSRGCDGSNAGLSRQRKKRNLSEPEQVTGRNFGKQNKFNDDLSGHQPKTGTKDVGVCEARNEVALMPAPDCHTEDTTTHKAGSKRKKAVSKDQQDKGGTTEDVEESLQPIYKQNRMSVAEITQDVVAMTGSRRGQTGRRKTLPNEQHIRARRKQTRKCVHTPRDKKEIDVRDEQSSITSSKSDDTPKEKKEIDVAERDETSSVTSSKSDDDPKVYENTVSLAEADSSRGVVRVVRKNTNKKCLEEGEGNVNSSVLMAASRRLTSLRGKGAKTDRKMDHQPTAATRNKQALTGSIQQGQESEPITELAESVEVKTRGDVQEAAAVVPGSSFKPMPRQAARKAARKAGDDGSVGSTSGETTVCEEVTSSEVSPPGRITRKVFGKEKSSEQTEGNGQPHSWSRLKSGTNRPGYGVEPIEIGRGKKRKTISTLARSEEMVILDASHAEDELTPSQRGRKAALKLTSQAPLTNVHGLQSCLNGVSSSSNISAASPNTNQASPCSASTTTFGKDQASQSHLSPTPSQSHLSPTPGRRGVRSRGRKSQVEVNTSKDVDSEKTENGQISALLPTRRRKIDTVSSQDNIQPGISSPSKMKTQSPSPAKKKCKQAFPAPSSPAGKRQPGKVESGSQVKLSNSSTPRVMLTGFVDKQADKVVKDLGGEMATNIEECTHLVTNRAYNQTFKTKGSLRPEPLCLYDGFQYQENPVKRLPTSPVPDSTVLAPSQPQRVCRTVKFLSGLAKGTLIVSRQWLASCKQAGTFLDEHDFLVVDTAMEKQYKFDLATSIRRAQTSPLLAGYKVHVTASVKPDPGQMEDILVSAGAAYLKTMPKKSQDNTVVISCLEDHDLCQHVIKAGLPVVGAEFILTGILRQELDFESYSLFKDGGSLKTAEKGRTRRK